ncbi:hypothetical protein KUTeg_016270 [Tegillarca granosa]|uniref:Histone acetyltransferase n=1 Tax=Tegillarca granosa TaxID=220873 RepID=A0ABQ9EQ88_TEGGR|nr:hypothetical protein KUTeg_016270 [Tegillarca granosa]
MSTAKYKEWILQTIDQLRMRKARPDMGRICHMAKRKHGLKYSETEAQLEKLVYEGVVVKVEFKGSISYRNASKSNKIKFGKILKPSSEIRDQIYDAIKDLSSGGDESTERKGAAVQDIEKWLLTNTREKSRILKSQLQEVLDGDVEVGKLKKLPSGNFVLNSFRKKKKKRFMSNKSLPVDETQIGNSVAPENSPNKRGRPPSKRKKFRKTHGPDFAESPIFPKKSSSNNDDETVCDFCLNNEECNSKGDREALLTCKDCNATAHPTCMGYNEGLARRALSSPWQCIDCKWNRPLDYFKIFSEKATNGASCLPTPCDSPASIEEDISRKEVISRRKAEKRKRSVDSIPNSLSIDINNYPDASKWNVTDVVNFFSKVGFKEQAESFKEQEIDGQSLLLMKRMDVLTGLNIKLGPALKIYQHVMKLQTAGIDLNSLS